MIDVLPLWVRPNSQKTGVGRPAAGVLQPGLELAVVGLEQVGQAGPALQHGRVPGG